MVQAGGRTIYLWIYACFCWTCVLTSVCPNGAASVGVCINNLCPAGFTCINNQCCPSTTTTTPSTITCTNPAAAVGPCLAGNTCSDGGFACDTTLNLCCPRVTAIGPCVGNDIMHLFNSFSAIETNKHRSSFKSHWYIWRWVLFEVK